MTTVLDKIFESKRRRVLQAKNCAAVAEAENTVAKLAPKGAGIFTGALGRDGINIIAEFKRASPS
ncbi:MAG: indole-3-glycerol-phosphate synthase TrpC, partial [Pyrinomonadaceae bacterium]